MFPLKLESFWARTILKQTRLLVIMFRASNTLDCPKCVLHQTVEVHAAPAEQLLTSYIARPSRPMEIPFCAPQNSWDVWMFNPQNLWRMIGRCQVYEES